MITIPSKLKVFSFIDELVRKNVSQVLAGKLQELTKNLRRMEKDYFEKRRKNSLDEDILPFRDKDNLGDIEYLNTPENLELQAIEEATMSRDVEIQNLVKGINDLAVIFKELSVLVIDQGNILDRIDYNIEQAVRHVKKGK